jgi:hypothetical protein
MNIDSLLVELLAKLDAQTALIEAQGAKIDDLERKIALLDERLTYREKVLVGWKKIADYLGVDATRTIFVYKNDPDDPLPVHYHFTGNVVALASALDAWKQRHALVVARRKEAERTGKRNDRAQANQRGRTPDGDPS